MAARVTFKGQPGATKDMEMDNSVIPNLSTALLDKMDAGDLAKLDAETLDALFWLVNEEATVAKRHEKRLHDALEGRYAKQASEALLADGRDTGTIHLIDGGFDVTVNRPKRVKWDDTKLRAALDTLDPDEARHLAKVEVKVDERKFAAASPRVQALLSDARTVETGKATYALARKQEMAA